MAFCIKCGTPLADGANFCAKCGTAAQAESTKAALSAEALYQQGKAAVDNNNFKEAFECYRNAAEQGNSEAQFEMGDFYHSGQNVTRDYLKAFEWFNKAASGGHVSAQNWMGNYYNLGLGVAKDYTKAAEWWSKAAAQGDTISQINLDNLIKSGNLAQAGAEMPQTTGRIPNLPEKEK